MKKSDIIRAWRDPEFRAGLSESERAALPAHPAAALELDAAALDTVTGGDDDSVSIDPLPVPTRTIYTAIASAYNCNICCV